MAWNRPNEKKVEAGRKGGLRNTHLKGLVAGVIVVLGAGLAAWLIWPDAKPPLSTSTSTSTSLIKTVKPAKTPKPKPKAETVKPEKTKEPEPLTWLGKKVVKFSAETNEPTGFIVESYVTEDGKLHKHLIEPKTQVFDNVADDAIAMAISTPPGQVMPPMPLYPGFEREFEAALKKPVEFKDDDTPEIRALKEQVAATREEVKRLMAEGQTIREILTEHQKIWNENAELHNKYQRELSEIVRSGDLELAHKYELKMNAALQQVGIPEIRIPDLNKKKHLSTEQ